MRKVFSSHQEVAEVWARQGQTAGRAGNIFFEGETIYSYGYHFPIARIEGKNCLYTTRSNSNSTAKHKSIALRAIPSFCKVVCVENPVDNDISIINRNIKTLRETIETLKGKASRARNKKEYYLSWVADKEKNLAEYCELRGIGLPKEETEQPNLFVGISGFSGATGATGN